MSAFAGILSLCWIIPNCW